MSLPNSTTIEHYSYADYLSWPADERWELIDGVPYNMSPAPSVRHQRLSGELFRQIANHLKNKPCQVFASPFDVILTDKTKASDNYFDTVVQPDISVICDKSKLDDRGCNGAPDLVIEILSPATASKDLKLKYELYERYGVKEYWIIHPAEQTLLVYKQNESGVYGAADRYADDDKVAIIMLGDLIIDLGEVFAE